MPSLAKIIDVSVVAANYNNGAFLVDFFESWIQSTHWPKELIFVEDGSTDNSLEIAQSYIERFPQLVIIDLKKNLGFANALNIGITQSSCKYILRIDPDDIVIRDRLAEQYQALESGLADVVGSNAIIFNSISNQDICSTNFPTTHEKIFHTITRGEHGVLHPTVMAHAELFKTHPYIQENVPAEDYDIFARMAKSGARFLNLSKPLLRYRVHQRSASNILPISTIEKTYKIRDSIFLTRSSKTQIYLYYWHIKSYRKFLFSKNPATRILYAFLAASLRPQKAVNRIRFFLTRVNHEAG